MKIRLIFSILLTSLIGNATADWHEGKIIQLNIGYDGSTITLIPKGWTRNNCTCYPVWPTTMCLDNNRSSHAFEKAMILSAKARGKTMAFHIEETTCRIIAMYELE